MNRSSRPASIRTHRRAVVLIVMVLMLSLLHLLVLGSLAPTRDEAAVATMRIETIRAFYAAESAIPLVIARARDQTGPATGQDANIALLSSTAQILQWPQTGLGQVLVEGRSGHAVRRIEIELE